MKKVTLGNYRKDIYYPKVTKAVAVLLRKEKEIAPAKLFIEMGQLDLDRYEDWLNGRVPYLERVIQGSLGKLSRILRLLRFHAHDLNLAPRIKPYSRGTKSGRMALRFTKTGDKKLEEAYARHFIKPGKKVKNSHGREQTIRHELNH